MLTIRYANNTCGPNVKMFMGQSFGSWTHGSSVPLNQLIKIPGTPLENKDDLNPFELIKTISVARIMMPKSYIRLSAGRTKMNESTQALAFFAGANSIFQGDILLPHLMPVFQVFSLLE